MLGLKDLSFNPYSFHIVERDRYRQGSYPRVVEPDSEMFLYEPYLVVYRVSVYTEHIRRVLYTAAASHVRFECFQKIGVLRGVMALYLTEYA